MFDELGNGVLFLIALSLFIWIICAFWALNQIVPLIEGQWIGVNLNLLRLRQKDAEEDPWLIGYSTFILVVIVVFEILLAGILFWLSTWEEIPDFWISLSSSIGISLFGVAVLTGFIEPIIHRQERKRSEAALKNTKDELMNISADKMVEILIGDKQIFEEIEQHIIRQNFILREFRLHIDLDWKKDPKTGEEDKEFLKRTMTISHLVENISEQDAEYTKVISETLENEDVYPSSTRFIKLEYQERGHSTAFQNDSKPFGNELQKLTTQREAHKKSGNDPLPFNRKEETLTLKEEHNQLVLKLDPINIPSREFVWFEQVVEAVNRAHEFHTQTISTLADGFDVAVTHPPDLDVSASLIHPASDRFKPEGNQHTEKYKRWILNAGVLPHQGILIPWKKTTHGKSGGDQVDP